VTQRSLIAVPDVWNSPHSKENKTLCTFVNKKIFNKYLIT